MKQPESHQSQTAAEHPAAEKKQTGDCGNNYSADKVSEEQNNPEVNTASIFLGWFKCKKDKNWLKTEITV